MADFNHEAYEPPQSLWKLVEENVSAGEREEIRDILGMTLVEQSLELQSEVKERLKIKLFTQMFTQGWVCKMDFYNVLMAHNWQKWKRAFLTCHCHKIYRDEAVGLKKMQIYLKNYDFCETVKFGAMSWKFDILSITA